MATPQCCYLAKGAKRPSHTTITIKVDRIPFDACKLIKRFDLCPFDQKNSTYLQPPVLGEDISQVVFYVFSTFVGDRVAGQCECPLIVATQQNRRIHRHQAEEGDQELQIDGFLCIQSQGDILGFARAKCHTPLLFGRPRVNTTKTT